MLLPINLKAFSMTKDSIKTLLKKRHASIKAANKRAGICIPRTAPVVPIDPEREALIKQRREERNARNMNYATMPAVVEAAHNVMLQQVKACEARIALMEDMEATYNWIDSQTIEATMGK